MRAYIGLAVAAFGLAWVITAEFAGWQSLPEEAAFVRPLTSPGNAVMSPQPVLSGADRRAEILARPLFAPDRRPAATEARSVNGLPRLTGIVVNGSRRVAIFAGASGGKAIVADEGVRLGTFEVKTISDSGVTIAGPEGTTVLRPIFDAGAPAVAKTALPVPSKPLGR